jgi:hypothetical protein
MKSTTTINSEIKTNPEINTHRFWSNFDPGKTHKGKTSERGDFIIIFKAPRKNIL